MQHSFITKRNGRNVTVIFSEILDNRVELLIRYTSFFSKGAVLYDSNHDMRIPIQVATESEQAYVTGLMNHYLRVLDILGIRVGNEYREITNKFTNGKRDWVKDEPTAPEPISVTKKEEPAMSNNKPELYPISRREFNVGVDTVVIDLLLNKQPRLRLVRRDEGNNGTFANYDGLTKYDSLRDVCAPKLREETLLQYLYTCFAYYPPKLAEIGVVLPDAAWHDTQAGFLTEFVEASRFSAPAVFRPRNLIAVVLNVDPHYPNGDKVSDEVRDTLKLIVESTRHRITGVVDEKKYFSPRDIGLMAPHSKAPGGCNISFFCNEKEGYVMSTFADSLKGVLFDFILIEPDDSQTVPVRSWSIMHAYISSFTGVKPVFDVSLPLEERSPEVEFVFSGEQHSGEATRVMATQILSTLNIQSANPHYTNPRFIKKL